MLKTEKIDEKLAGEIYQFIHEAGFINPEDLNRFRKKAEGLLHKIDYRPHVECENLAEEEFAKHVDKYILTKRLHSDELHGNIESEEPILVRVLMCPVKRWDNEAFQTARFKLFWKVQLVNSKDIKNLAKIQYYIEGTTFWENGKNEKPDYYTVTSFDPDTAVDYFRNAWGEISSAKTQQVTSGEPITPEKIKGVVRTLLTDLSTVGIDLSYLLGDLLEEKDEQP